MVKEGHRVVACAADDDLWVNMAGIDVHEKLREMGVEYYSVPLKRTGLNPFQDLQTILSLYRLMKLIHPDVVLAYTLKPVMYSSIAAKIAQIPDMFSMITGTGSMLNKDSKNSIIGKIIRLMLHYALSFNKNVFFQNPDDRNLFIENKLLGKNSSSTMINGSGVDLAHYKEIPTVTAPFTFLLLARLIKEKGIIEYVEAARLIKTKMPETRFLLFGLLESPARGIKEEDVKKWCANGIIDYRGAVTDVRPALAESSVYVLPSYHEGTPHSVLEAMASGRPIITTDAPGCRETVIEGENGFLVPPKDTNALADAMMRFITSPELVITMGKRSREIAEEKYDVHKVNAVVINTMHLHR